MQRITAKADLKEILNRRADWTLRTSGKEETETVTNLELLHKIKLAHSFHVTPKVFMSFSKYIVYFSETRWAERER